MSLLVGIWQTVRLHVLEGAVCVHLHGTATKPQPAGIDG